MIEAEAVVTWEPLHAYGVNFLVAVELRSWLTKEMGSKAAALNTMENGSSKGLAGVVAGKNELVNGEATVAVPLGSTGVSILYTIPTSPM